MNHLASEKSPYLKQHQHNPVNWYPWGEEAFSAAQEQNKPIFLSIGYSTCYWCHVMEKDSFERDDVAEVLNRHFISIKVDREERPDVDAIYMDAVVAASGQGGWPMSVFLTSDLRPFFGGTFFYRAQFLKLLEHIAEAWTRERPKLVASSHELTEYLRAATLKETGKRELPPISTALSLAARHLSAHFDSQYGGFGSPPKFPPSAQLNLLMRTYRRTREAKLLPVITSTLDGMIRGGLYDHVGGGFHRYSVDEKWLVPHFEKMLYDNALLARTYLFAYQLTKNEDYAQAASSTLDYLVREMHADGFYSAQDAGEVEREGEYYVWTAAQLQNELSAEEFKLLQEIFDIREDGNFEHGTLILRLREGIAWKERRRCEAILQKLLAVRTKRTPPHLDDKILTGWNGLAIAALSLGSRVLQNKGYLSAARSAIVLIQTKMSAPRLQRRYHSGEARFDATLEDYAYLMFGVLSFLQSSPDQNLLEWACSLQEEMDTRLWDQERGGYYTAGEDASLIVRKREFSDGATPSPNAIAAWNLATLFAMTGEQKYLDRVQKILQPALSKFDSYPSAFSTALEVLDMISENVPQLSIVASNQHDVAEKIALLSTNYLPEVTILPVSDSTKKCFPVTAQKSSVGGKTTYYLCCGTVCDTPTGDWTDIQQKLSIF